MLLALVVLSAIGVAISKISPQKAFRYRLVTVPIFGGVSPFSSGSSACAGGLSAGGVLGR